MAGPRRKCSPKKGGAKIGSKAKREENAMEDSAQRKGEDLETRLAEHLQCSVCLEVMHRATAMLPCFHRACAGCTSKALVEDVKADHVVREVISELQTANPKRKREASDITELDAAEKELDGRLKKHKRRRLCIFSSTDVDEDDDSYSDGSDSDWSDVSGSDIDVTHLDEATGNLLVAVANFEDFDELEELLESGANVNGQDGAERTALHHAVLEDLDEVIEYLVNAGADTEIVDSNGETPLMVAVNVQSYECLEKLLECHANVETAGFDGDTPLHSAAEQCNEEMLLTLLSFGANVDARNAEMLTPVMAAVQDGEDDDLAAQVVRTLIQNGADSGAKDSHGYTALLRAVGRNMVDCVTELVSAGVDVNETDASGWTALHQVCLRHTADEDDGGIEIVESLVSSGSADVNVVTRDRMKETPLHILIRSGFGEHDPSDRGFVRRSVAIMRRLLDAQADCNVPDYRGARPLHILAGSRHLSTEEMKDGIETLLRAGADPALEDDEKNTAADLAEDQAIKALLSREQSATRRRNAEARTARSSARQPARARATGRVERSTGASRNARGTSTEGRTAAGRLRSRS